MRRWERTRLGYVPPLQERWIRKPTLLLTLPGVFTARLEQRIKATFGGEGALAVMPLIRTCSRHQFGQLWRKTWQAREDSRWKSRFRVFLRARARFDNRRLRLSWPMGFGQAFVPAPWTLPLQIWSMVIPRVVGWVWWRFRVTEARLTRFRYNGRKGSRSRGPLMWPFLTVMQGWLS